MKKCLKIKQHFQIQFSIFQFRHFHQHFPPEFQISKIFKANENEMKLSLFIKFSKTPKKCSIFSKNFHSNFKFQKMFEIFLNLRAKIIKNSL